MQSADDARAVVDAGADAVVVSNHGGRQLDRAPTPLEQLPAVVAAVGDRAEVYLDGGVLDGADVVAAVALGARTCLVGRAYLYGLMAGGERGVQRAADILAGEVRRTLQLLGVTLGGRADPGPRAAALTARTRVWRGEVGQLLGCRDGRRGVHPQLRAVRVHLRRGRPRLGGCRPAQRCGCGPTTRSAGRCARPPTCRARRSTCATSTRRPARSTSRAPSRATRWRCTWSAWSRPATGVPRRHIPFFGGMTGTDRVVTLQDAAAGPHLDLRAGPGAEHRHLRRQARRPAGGPAGRADARARSASPRPAARCAARWCPTGSAATWTPRRCAPAPPATSASTSRARCSRVGDGHYRQGEGEACGTAVEGAMTSTVIVELIKGGAPAWPRIEDDTHWMTVGSAAGRSRTPGGSGRSSWCTGSASCTACTRWTPTSCCRRSPRCRSPTSSTSTTAPSSRPASRCCPTASAYGGLHADLRARAATLL